MVNWILNPSMVTTTYKIVMMVWYFILSIAIIILTEHIIQTWITINTKVKNNNYSSIKSYLCNVLRKTSKNKIWLLCSNANYVQDYFDSHILLLSAGIHSVSIAYFNIFTVLKEKDLKSNVPNATDPSNRLLVDQSSKIYLSKILLMPWILHTDRHKKCL